MSGGKGDAPGFGKGDAQENFERMTGLARGAKGEQGERGERGLSWRVRWAIVVLFVLAILPGAVGWLWWVHEVNSNAAAQRSEQVAQQQQGAALERKLCTSLGRLAALEPPPGSPVDNPSRAYLQQQHAVLAELGPDLGCGP